MGVGDVQPWVVEDRYNFMVVRLLSQNNRGDDILLGCVVIAKLTFTPWFQEQSQLVPLVVNDQVLREALLAEVDIPYITDRLAEDE